MLISKISGNQCPSVRRIAAGIDFGTSNSAISCISGSNFDVEIIRIENDTETIPTALFYLPNGSLLFGSAASEAFIRNEEGRFIHSIKSILGTSMMNEYTRINNKWIKFSSIIGRFISFLKSKLDEHAGGNVDSVVFGRPVKFNEADEALDKHAEDLLAEIAKRSGFKFVEFQYEPVAAAFSHEQSITHERLAIVVDVGGGTSDFTMIKIGGRLKDKLDRSGDILANTGVKVGGDAFDKGLSYHSFMPLLGRDGTLGEKKLPMPSYIYHELSDWNGINFMYSVKNLREIRKIHNESNDKEKTYRMMRLIETERAHELLGIVERVKIDLTQLSSTECILDPVADKPLVYVSRTQFDEYAVDIYEKIRKAMVDCLKLSGLKADEIDMAIMTGGSTEINQVRNIVRSIVPNAVFSEQNKFISVCKGLAYEAKRRFIF